MTLLHALHCMSHMKRKARKFIEAKSDDITLIKILVLLAMTSLFKCKTKSEKKMS